MAMFTRGNIAESLPTRWPPLRGEDASQLMEFAIALPLLVVLVIGIFDFGTAFNLKQELNNAAREGARFASSQPTNDMCPSSCTPPPSIAAVLAFVDSYLQAAGINDCGLGSATGSTSSWTWTYSTTPGTNGCPPSLPLTLTINRGVTLGATSYGNPNTYVMTTHVSIAYPFQWRFNRVITLIAPGANYAGVSQINTDAWAVNMN